MWSLAKLLNTGQFDTVVLLVVASQMMRGQAPQIFFPRTTPDVLPIREKHVKTCIELKYGGQQISALLDTGSDVSIAGEDVARKYGWVVHDHPTKNVKIANDEEMIIDEPQKFFYRLENETFILRFLLHQI